MSVLENRPEDSQIVVVLRDVYGDPYDLKDEIVFVHAPLGTDPTRCVNLGIDASGGRLIHVLAPGVEVCPGWVDAALASFEDPDVAIVAPAVHPRGGATGPATIGLEYFDRGTVRRLTAEDLDLAQPSGSRRRWAPDPRAGFYRRSVLDRFGRFAIDLEWAWAVVDFALLVDRIGCGAVAEPYCRVSAGADEEVSSSAYRRAISAERLFWRWLPRRGKTWALAGHVGHVLAEAAGRLPGFGAASTLAGRTVGFATASSGRHRRQLDAPAPGQREEQHAAGRPHFADRPVSKADEPVQSMTSLRRRRAG